MRLFSLTILAFFFWYYSGAQNLNTRIDSVKKKVTILSYTNLLPSEFSSLSQENIYYSDSNSVNTANSNYIFILKLRSNCTFFYEIYYKPYNRTRVGFYIGKYTMVNNTIHLVYRPLPSGHPEKTYMSPVTPVSWSLPDRPEYLLVKKSLLTEPKKKGQTKKTLYIQKDKLQFDIGNCNSI
jgi:hypothetical protein